METASKMTEEQVVLVNPDDTVLGYATKTEAHVKGLLHRAVSVVIRNTRGEILLQQRSYQKYHSGGLWTNTCCTHPRPGEGYREAAERRLMEEMGLTTDLTPLALFIYKERIDQEMTEHELDYIFVGITDEQPVINLDEVAGYTYIPYEVLKKDIIDRPEHYTVWFHHIFSQLKDL